jgi:hypothetical protein
MKKIQINNLNFFYIYLGKNKYKLIKNLYIIN